MSKKVSIDDLSNLFADLVENLSGAITSGEATAKDKELALKLIEMNNIGVDMSITPEHVEALDHDLPFDELHPN